MIQNQTQNKELKGFNIFKKTEQEKLELKLAKSQHKAMLKKLKQNELQQNKG